MAILTAKHRALFGRDGVTAVRGLLSPELRRHVAAAMDDVCANAASYVADNSGHRFIVEGGLWLKDGRFGDVIATSGLIDLVSGLVGGVKLNLLDDQLFVKEARSTSLTPWHHDITFWPFVGRKLLSVWVALDRVSSDNGGDAA